MPPWTVAPERASGRAMIDIANRTATANALTAWHTHMFDSDAPLTRGQRTVIAGHVAAWLGDGRVLPPDDALLNPLDQALCSLADEVTLAPWRISDASFQGLCAQGFDDVALFDVCATASSAGVFSRIAVARAALAV
jgi:hypothetical protein